MLIKCIFSLMQQVLLLSCNELIFTLTYKAFRASDDYAIDFVITKLCNIDFLFQIKQKLLRHFYLYCPVQV